MNFSKIMLGFILTICFFIIVVVGFSIFKTLFLTYGVWSVVIGILFIGIWMAITLFID